MIKIKEFFEKIMIKIRTQKNDLRSQSRSKKLIDLDFLPKRSRSFNNPDYSIRGASLEE